jgi:hypothetical protein
MCILNIHQYQKKVKAYFAKRFMNHPSCAEDTTIRKKPDKKGMNLKIKADKKFLVRRKKAGATK